MTTLVATPVLSKESCRQALRAVIDPEIYQNIIDLGLVYDVAVTPDNAVTVTMTLTTPHCPMGPQIIENVQGVLQAHGARDVTVNIVWEPAWSVYSMTGDLQRQLGILPADQLEEEQEEVLPPPPPEPPKKKGLLRRLFRL
jgi:metal-sulfur cluster biosynthetic enzyme